MKRVGGLKRQLATGVVSQSLDGKTAGQQLQAIRAAVLPMLAAQARVYREEIRPALRTHGVHLLDWHELTDDERKFADEYFRRDLFPVLTPLAVDPGHPFPFISNLSESLGIVLRHPDEGERLFARVKIPANLPSWIRLGVPTDGSYRYARLQDIMIDNLPALFPDMEVLGVMLFRVTRNGDIERDEEDAEDLLEMMEEELRARRFARVVRLEHGPNLDPWLLRFLLDELELASRTSTSSRRARLHLLAPAARASAAAAQGRAVGARGARSARRQRGRYLQRNPQRRPARAPSLRELHRKRRALFSAAAADDKVLAIKMTLYRTGDESPSSTRWCARRRPASRSCASSR